MLRVIYIALVVLLAIKVLMGQGNSAQLAAQTPSDVVYLSAQTNN